MRWWLALAALGLFIGPAAADPLSDYAEAIEGRSDREWAELEAARQACSPATALRIEPREIMIDSAGLHGRCVTVSGVMLNRWIYPEPYHLYLSSRWAAEYRGEVWQGRTNPFHFGIDRREPPPSGPWFHQVTVTGVVKDCATFGEVVARSADVQNMNRRDGTAIISLLTGYCHMENGAVIDPVDIDYQERLSPPRLTGEAARELFGSLRQIDESLPQYAEIVAKMQAFIAGLQGSYPPPVSMLYYTEEEAEDLRSYMADPASPLRDFTEGEYQIAIFELRRLPRASETDGEITDLVNAVCACREGDCFQLWPLAPIDVLAGPSQPYVCFDFAFASTRDIEEGAEPWVITPALPRPGLAATPFRDPGVLTPDERLGDSPAPY